MKLKELDHYFKQLLNIDYFSNSDSSLNTIQVGDAEQEIKTCAFAVDACQQSIDCAKNAGADLLFVHHGFFWGRPIAITNNHYNRVKTLIENNISLYACHLPLDAHPLYGNNISLAKTLDLQEIEPFGWYKGKQIGFKGSLATPADLNTIITKLGTKREDCLSVLPLGKAEIKTIAIVSGGAADDVREAISDGIDLYITGEVSHQIYHECLESKINFVAAGHYFTETFGVKAVAKQVEKELGLKTIFISNPTQL